MQFSGEFTMGALGIIISIIASACGGIGTILTIYFKMRTDVTSLQLGHAGLKTDIAEVKGDVKTIHEKLNSNGVMLERVMARQETIATISNLPDQIAVSVGKLLARERA